jgi:hypothetical protein
MKMLRECGTYVEEEYDTQGFGANYPRDEATWKT